MAGIYVNDEGTWKLPKSIWVNDGTSTSGATGWRVCKNVYVNDNGFWREMIRSVDLTSSQRNFNLWEYVGSPSEPLSLIFNIASTVEIGSEGPSLPDYFGYITRTNLPKRPTAFTVGNFASGSTVIINNNGYISGGGGFGGAGGNSPAKGPNWPNETSGSTGGAGGDGIVKGSNNNFDCTIVNTGTIAGGGGGGGGAGSEYIPPAPWVGPTYSMGGNGGDGAGITGYSKTQGGSSASNADERVTRTDGGQGGAVGENGREGEAGGGTNDSTPNGDGGQAGKAIIANGIEIAVSGNIDGAIV